MTTRRALGLCILALVVGLAPAPAAARLDSKAWKAARSEYEKLFKERGSAREKVAVLETIASDGSARAWKLLGQAFELEVGRVARIRTEYTKAASIHGDILLATLKGYSPDQEDRARDVQRRMKPLEEDLRGEGQVLDALIRILAAGPPTARKPVLKLARPKAALPLREAAARVAGGALTDKAALTFIKKALASEPEAVVRAAALVAVASAKELPEKAHALVTACLADEDADVVRQAAAVVAAHPFAAACAPLRSAWDGASPHVRLALAKAIAALLADASLGEATADLETWWAQQDTSPVAAVIATIPLPSDGVLFVLDVSTYMKPEMKDGAWKRDPPAAKAPPTVGISGPRLDMARHELQMALRRLPETMHFNILAFNHGAGLWQRSMKPATKGNKDLAHRWLKGLKASGAAYVEGALRLAFRAAGAFSHGADVSMPQIDTIVLLSAGTTTNNAFPTHGPVEPAGVLALLRDWNRSTKLVVHAVSFGESEFMKTLAGDHGGTYVHR